ncbi:MAG: Dabb family protein [Sporolactobacillus sp.]|jgi:heme-degrading monooxygenase HmoA|nr:Dabb family protein [Sporolactobacillus sp.]MCI1882508.1 Dabb family protein [Sporolactobacillus sp.]
MIEHIVLFKFDPQTTDEQKQEGARRLRHLIHELPGIIDIQSGLNDSSRSKGYSLGLTVRFQSKADHEHYTPSPEHQAVVSYLKKIGLADSLAVDFELPDQSA